MREQTELLVLFKIISYLNIVVYRTVQLIVQYDESNKELFEWI